MIDWFKKYKHLLNESYLVDIDDEDDDSLDGDDELISKSGKVLSMGDLGEHKHIMCFKISGVTFSGEILKNRLADFQDNFMELVEDVMYIDECVTNFVFDRDYILNSYIPLNKLKLNIDSTLCVSCNSLKALALLKKIVVIKSEEENRISLF